MPKPAPWNAELPPSATTAGSPTSEAHISYPQLHDEQFATDRREITITCDQNVILTSYFYQNLRNLSREYVLSITRPFTFLVTTLHLLLGFSVTLTCSGFDWP